MNHSYSSKIRSVVFLTTVLCMFQSCATAPQLPAAPITPEAQTASSTCNYNREQILALDMARFDQDTSGGWRTVAQQPGCLGAAADLIRDYHSARPEKSYLLYWHEGQVRAMNGEVAKATELFALSYNQQDDNIGWNIYVDATLAFMKQDRNALLKAYLALANLPVPAHLQLDENGNSLADSWPPNMKVVEDLLACFGQEYRQAYQNCGS